MVGLRRNSRFVPLEAPETCFSNLLRTSSSVFVTLRKRFSPVIGSTPSNRALPPPTKKARTPAFTLCMTCAWQVGVWLKCLIPRPVPPRQYPPAVRGRAPPVRFGRRDEAKGAPPRCRMTFPTLLISKEERSYTFARDALSPRLRTVVENQR